MSKLEELIKELCPDGVEYKTLGELGKFYSGLSGKTKDDFTDGNERFITYMNVFSNISIKVDVKDFVKISKGEKQNTIQYGDVIFTGSSETPNECGMSSVLTIKTCEKLYLNSFCFGFRFFDSEIYNPDFSKYMFRSINLRKQIVKTASGVTRFNVSKKKMEKVRIPILPLAIQQEIVRILENLTDVTEKIKTKLQEEIKARKKQYEYYREELLAFRKHNVNWITLGEIGPVCMCKRIMKAQTNANGEVPFYKIGTFGKEANAYISKEIYEKYKNTYKFPKKGDILISAAGTIGRTIVYNGEPAYFQDSNIVWIDNDESKVSNKFLIYCYAMNPWAISTGGTIARLYNSNISNARIPAPSLEIQEKIVSIIEKIDLIYSQIIKKILDEIEARQKQYEYYRDKLLSFKELKKEGV
ncbi:MAG: restriction endonuclease subunit S [Clostridium butyricum]|nr:restriction endonuclease subunit S [Clostridium butyricum]MDU4853202.1 restriction endonuclease subunit S [Clostridioides difficile]